MTFPEHDLSRQSACIRSIAFRLSIVAIAAAMLSPLFAQSEYTLDGTPTGLEEEVRWHTNRARFDSAAENVYRGTNYNDVPATARPLAPHQSITAAARHHSLDMANLNIFQHATIPGSAYYNSVTQPNPGSRLQAEGYSWNYYGENITAGTNYNKGEVAYASWWNSAGHRVNFMNTSFTEFGHGYAPNAASTYKNYHTMNLGRSGSTRFFTGTIFHDTNGSGKYEASEGIAGIEIKLVVNGSLFSHFDRSSASGAFAVPIQTIAAGATVEVVLHNPGASTATLSIPRSYLGYETVTILPGASRTIGTFLTTSTVENFGIRNLTRTLIIPVLTVTRQNGNNSITWLSASQQSYTLQFSAGLDSWQNLNSIPFSGSGAEIQHSHTGASSHSKAFYRLMIN